MKKLLALVLAVALVFGTVGFAAAAPADVEGTKYEDAAERLGALKIMIGDDRGFRPGDPITRAEFAKVVVAALGLNEAAQYAKGATKFADVPAEHWASGYVNVAVDLGVINGYPDGTFQPAKEVSYAEAIKMLVAALGYTPKANAMGGYPGGYLAVAAEKEITDGITVVGGMSASRGDVALMVDNSLEVPMMVQKTWGQYPEYEEDESQTLLAKLGVDEVEGTVDAVPLSDSKLEDNQLKIDGEEYTVLVDVDVNSLFGLEVKAWADDDEIFFVDVDTAEDDILHDTVVSADSDEVKLYVVDDTFAWADDAKVYVNFDKASVKDVDADMYGRVVLNDDDEVVFANLFKFDEVEGAVVTAVDGKVYEYVAFDGSESEIDLDDYEDGVFLFDTEFNKVDADEIDVDSAIYAWEVSDELYLVVKNETVEGTLERVKSDEIRVDGDVYSIASGEAVVSEDAKDSFDLFDAVTDFDNLMDEEVVVVLNLKGEVAMVYGDSEATSDTMYGIVTYGNLGRDGEATIFTKDGEEVDYVFEKRSDVDTLNLDHVEYYGDADDTSDSLRFAAIKFELNSDGEIAEGAEVVDIDYGTGSLPADVQNKIGDLDHTADKGYVTIDDNGDNIGKRYYISESTVFMKALNSDGELDPKVVDYEDIYESTITAEKVAFFASSNGSLKLVVFLNKDFQGADDDVYYGVVTDSPWKDGSDWVVTIDVFGEGEKEYVVEDKADFAEGSVVAFYLNNDDEAVHSASGTADNDGATYADGYAEGVYKDSDETNETYKVASGAVIYLLDDEGAVDKKISATKISNYEKFTYVLKDYEIVAATVQTEKTDSGTTEPTGITFSYDEGTDVLTVSGLVYDDGGDNEYFVRISGDALDVAVYSTTDALQNADDKVVTFDLTGEIPANGIYKVELINTADFTEVIATKDIYMLKNN